MQHRQARAEENGSHPLRQSKSFIVYTALVCILQSVASANQFIPISQNRNLNVETHAQNGAFVDDDSDMSQASDFNPYDDLIMVSSSVPSASANARAEQHSSITSDRILIQGNNSCSSFTEAQGTLASSISQTTCTFGFDLPIDAEIVISGSINSVDFGQVSLELRDPNGALGMWFVQGLSDSIFLDEHFELSAGSYSIRLNTFADFTATDGDAGGQGASFDVTVDFADVPPIMDCDESGTPDVADVFGDAWIIHGISTSLIKNADLLNGADDETIGSLGPTIQTARGLTVHPTTGELHTIVETGGAAFLATVDETTGVATPTVVLQIPNLFDIAFRNDGVLFGVQVINPGEIFEDVRIITIDTTTGQIANTVVTLVNSLLTGHPHVIEFADGIEGSLDGRLIYLSGVFLYATNTHANTFSLLSQNLPENDWSALAQHPNADPFFGLFFTIDNFGQVYRLELNGDVTALNDAAVTPDTRGLVLRPRAADANKNQVPDVCEMVGDLNCDFMVDTSDIPLFIDVLLGNDTSGICAPDAADMNDDVLTDGDDLQGFVNALVTSP